MGCLKIGLEGLRIAGVRVREFKLSEQNGERGANFVARIGDESALPIEARTQLANELIEGLAQR